jgi:hypothetical protein
MKKTLIIFTAILLLAGCTQKSSPPETDINKIQKNDIQIKVPVSETNTTTFTDETFKVSFQYPSDWKVLGGPEESNDHAINLISNNGQENFYFDYKYNYNITQKEIDERFKISIEEFQNEGRDTIIGSYPAKEIGMHGGINYLIEIKEQFLLVNSEFYLSEEQEKGLQIILDSISF